MPNLLFVISVCSVAGTVVALLGIGVVALWTVDAPAQPPAGSSPEQNPGDGHTDPLGKVG